MPHDVAAGEDGELEPSGASLSSDVDPAPAEPDIEHGPGKKLESNSAVHAGRAKRVGDVLSGLQHGHDAVAGGGAEHGFRRELVVPQRGAARAFGPQGVHAHEGNLLNLATQVDGPSNPTAQT